MRRSKSNQLPKAQQFGDRDANQHHPREHVSVRGTPLPRDPSVTDSPVTESPTAVVTVTAQRCSPLYIPLRERPPSSAVSVDLPTSIMIVDR
jgi:hypothetical protein